MVEDKNKTGNISDKDIKQQQDLIESVEALIEAKAGLNISSHLKGATSQPISADATLEEQLAYVEAKLKKHHKEKRKTALLPKEGVNEIALSINHNGGDEKVRLDRLKSILSKSDLAASLLEGHSARKVELVQDKQIFNVVFVKNRNIVAFNPQMTLGEAIYGVVRELRRAWLSSDGDVLYPLAYEPDDALLMHRILEADANTIAVWVAWELKLQGHNEAWSYLLSSNESLMAQAFAASARQDFRRLNNGSAAKAAFDARFRSGIQRYVDREIIQEMLADEQGYVFSSKKPPIVITNSLLDFIGEVPGDKNYMNAGGERPLPGTSYAAVTDRSNANFLWFVKFERSFQETENELLSQEKENQQILKREERSQTARASSSFDEGVVDLSAHFENQQKDIKGQAQQGIQKKVKNNFENNVIRLFVD